jgi:hypothetical protein
LSDDARHDVPGAARKKVQVATASSQGAAVGKAPYLSFIDALRQLAATDTNGQGKERVTLKGRVYEVSMSGWNGEGQPVPASATTDLVHFDFLRGPQGKWDLWVVVIDANQQPFTSDVHTFEKLEDDDMVFHWATCIAYESLAAKKHAARSGDKRSSPGAWQGLTVKTLKT